jgi:pyrroline-5-carboxylate reductase
MERFVFIGGGNMASALIGGLLRGGTAAETIVVIEPDAAQRERLHRALRVEAQPAAGAELAGASVVVWAVKPQSFAEAAAPCAPFVGGALQLSVMAGIRSDSIARAALTERVVRAMPNTPALIGRGIAGLYARPAVTAAEREQARAVLSATGATLWVGHEDDLDAVTAISGSGPAYVFFVVEAMMRAAREMGLSEEQGRTLALATFDGAAALAAGSPLHPAELRAQVTSKGGTTAAALAVLEAAGVQQAFVDALLAAQRRAAELGRLFAEPAPTR